MQLSTYIFNGYLLFSTTAILEEGISNFEDSKKFCSLFMIFGYANGTDDVIDISYYFNDDNNYGQNSQNNNNFLNLLKNNIIIENNIFRYKSAESIKLVSIPEEILIFEKDYNDPNELILLGNNSFMYFDCEYILQQNINLSKTSEFYHIDYQNILREQSIEEYYDYQSELQDFLDEIGGSTERLLSIEGSNLFYEPKIFYGRINRIKFKLCHEF